jgi:hypothetical protein
LPEDAAIEEEVATPGWEPATGPEVKSLRLSAFKKEAAAAASSLRTPTDVEVA